ncbi:MAG: hypothetical protein DRJ38_03140 [Thermoprotei archaeon]|nr:MAG: hypothetical protein DRJ38_03140 [Thermoprotei archaeon]
MTKASSPGLLIKRYGEWPRLYLTIRNPSKDPKPLRVEVEAEEGIDSVNIDVLWGKVEVSTGIADGIIFIQGEEIDPGKTVVLSLTSSMAKDIDDGNGICLPCIVAMTLPFLLVIIVVFKVLNKRCCSRVENNL